MNRQMRGGWLAIGLAVLMLVMPGVQVNAQGDGEEACPALVVTVLDSMADTCAATGRNEACYGSFRVDAALRDEAVTFEAPADVAPLYTLETIRTYGMDTAADVWGVALLRAQADLPESLPGQNVTFLLFGNVSMTNEGYIGAAAPEAVSCAATVQSGANLRSGPGTGYNIVGGAAAGDDLTLTGRNAAGDWVQFAAESGEAWIFADLVDDLTCAIADLPVTEAGVMADVSMYGPMQAFTFETGLGGPACAEAPADSLVIRSPEGEVVTLRANGVDITLGSAVGLSAGNGALGLAVLEGQATVRVESGYEVVPAGFQVEVPMNADMTPAGAPSAPAPYPADAWTALEAVPADLVGGDPLAVAEPGTLTTWSVTSTILTGGTWSDSGTDVTVRERPMLITADGETMVYRRRTLTRTGENTYSGTQTWMFQDAESRGTYDLTFTGESTFTMDWTVAQADRSLSEFLDEAERIE
jgi:hypothetical protein